MKSSKFEKWYQEWDKTILFTNLMARRSRLEYKLHFNLKKHL